jgi:hypothetical protein
LLRALRLETSRAQVEVLPSAPFKGENMNFKKRDAAILMVVVSFIICEACIIYAIRDNKIVGMISAIMVFVFASLVTKLTRVDSLEIDIDDGEVSVNKKAEVKVVPDEVP